MTARLLLTHLSASTSPAQRPDEARETVTPHSSSELARPRSFRTVGARSRLLTMLVAGVVVGVVTGLVKSWDYAPVAGWDAATLVFGVWVWSVIGTVGPPEVRLRCPSQT